MRHVSLFEALASRTEDLTGIPATQHDQSFRATGVRDVVLQGLYEQAELPGRQDPPFWRSVNNDDGYWYSPQYLPGDDQIEPVKGGDVDFNELARTPGVIVN